MSSRLDKDARFWDRAAEKYAAAKIADEAGYERTLDAVREHLRPEHSVLEIGCGTGMTALKLAPHVKSYVGTDISAEMIRIAREKAANTQTDGLAFQVASSDHQREASAPFDVILAFNILHLVTNPLKTLLALHNQLKPGGLMISKTPCLKNMNPLIRAIIPLMQFVGKAPSVESFTPDELDAFFSDAGFTSLEAGWHGTKGKDIRAYRVDRKPD